MSDKQTTKDLINISEKISLVYFSMRLYVPLYTLLKKFNLILNIYVRLKSLSGEVQLENTVSWRLLPA